MNPSDLINTILLGILEGVTEFLPISSTGHLIVAANALNFPPSEPRNYRETFEIFIQFGAVLAVVVYFARDLLRQAAALPSDRTVQRFWLNVLVAFIPAAIVAFILKDVINELQRHPAIVATALIVGGFVFLWVERKPRNEPSVATQLAEEPVKSPAVAHGLAQITTSQALFVGLSQIVALIPGVSRSGASIIGGLLVRLDRAVATRFSFYLAIPTLTVATAYQLLSAISAGEVGTAQIPVFAVGTFVTFVVALASIAWLLRYVATNDFRAFGIYRIIAGIVIFVLIALQVVAA